MENSVQKYHRLLAELNDVRSELTEALISELRAVPSLSTIKPLGGIAFVMKASSLSAQSWDPAYYDNKLLAEKVIEAGKGSLEGLEKAMREVCIGKNPKLRANPEFVQFLETLMQKYEMN